MARAVRIKPDLRRELILDAAIRLSAEIGYKSITRDAVANAAGISSTLVGKYYPTMIQLKTAVMEEAIARRSVEVVAQGLATRHPLALRIDDELRQEVVDYLSNIE
jgi:AcrR family transcriptional regulator